MSTTSVANLVAFLSGVFTLLNLGVTSADVSGFVKVIVALITLISIVVSHVAHKAQVASLSAKA